MKHLLLVLFLNLSIFNLCSSQGYPTQNCLEAVYNIAFNNKSATAFAVNYEGSIYLITVHHLFAGLKNGAYIKYYIHRGISWDSVQSKVFFKEGSNIDIAVLTSLPKDNHESIPIKNISIPYGAEVYFLGFPAAFYTNQNDSRGYPYPLIKKAIFSGVKINSDSIQEHLYDGLNTEGFSGSPVICKDYFSNSDIVYLTAIIAGYYQSNNNQNTGIISAVPTMYLIDIIKGK